MTLNIKRAWWLFHKKSIDFTVLYITNIFVIGELRQGNSDLATKKKAHISPLPQNISHLGNFGGREENSSAPNELTHFFPTSTTMSSASLVMPFFLVDTDFTPPFAQLPIRGYSFHFVISWDKATSSPVIRFGKGRHFFFSTNFFGSI